MVAILFLTASCAFLFHLLSEISSELMWKLSQEGRVGLSFALALAGTAARALEALSAISFVMAGAGVLDALR